MRIDNDNHIRAIVVREFPELLNDEQCLYDTLDGISNFSDQASRVLQAICDTDALCDGIDAMIAQAKARKERLTHRAERLRGLLLTAMQATGRTKLTLPEATLSVTKRQPGVIITNPDLVPPGYMTTPEPPPPKPNKAVIKAALVGGTPVPGCTLSNDGYTLTIRGA